MDNELIKTGLLVIAVFVCMFIAWKLAQLFWKFLVFGLVVVVVTLGVLHYQGKINLMEKAKEKTSSVVGDITDGVSNSVRETTNEVTTMAKESVKERVNKIIPKGK